MRRFGWQAALVAATVVAPLSAEPPAARPGPVSILARNLWDVLWDVRRPIQRTADSRYDWKWLCKQYDHDGDGIVTRDELGVPEEVFARLDRNWDGKLTHLDFDWSEKGVLGRQKEAVFSLFKSIDKSSEGRISSDEWQAIFAKVAKDKGYLTDEDLEELIFTPYAQRNQMVEQRFGPRAKSRSMSRGARLQQLLENGRLLSDGPEPGQIAPDFLLASPDRTKSVLLSSYRFNKPVVLIFGSFT